MFVHELLLGLLAALLLTGCAQKDTDEVKIIAGELTVLLELTASIPRDPLDQFIKDFEAKYTQVRVRVQEHELSFASIRNPSAADFEGVDVVLGQGWYWSNMRQLDLLRDMSALSLPPVDPTVAQVLDFDRGTVELTFVPLDFHTWMVMADEAKFEELGLQIPGVDWTYAEFESLLRALQEAGQLQPLTFGVIVNEVVLAYGGGFYDPAANVWTFDTSENRAALTFLQGLAKDGLLVTEPNANPGPVPLSMSRMMRSGHVPVPFPVGPAGRATASYGTYGVMMVNTSNHPEAAAVFVRELLESTVYAEAGVRPAVENPKALTAWEQSADSRAVTVTNLGLESLQEFQTGGVSVHAELRRFFKGELTVDELVQELQTKYAR